MMKTNLYETRTPDNIKQIYCRTAHYIRQFFTQGLNADDRFLYRKYVRFLNLNPFLFSYPALTVRQNVDRKENVDELIQALKSSMPKNIKEQPEINAQQARQIQAMRESYQKHMKELEELVQNHADQQMYWDRNDNRKRYQTLTNLLHVAVPVRICAISQRPNAKEEVLHELSQTKQVDRSTLDPYYWLDNFHQLN